MIVFLQGGGGTAVLVPLQLAHRGHEGGVRGSVCGSAPAGGGGGLFSAVLPHCAEPWLQVARLVVQAEELQRLRDRCNTHRTLWGQRTVRDLLLAR